MLQMLSGEGSTSMSVSDHGSRPRFFFVDFKIFVLILFEEAVAGKTMSVGQSSITS